MKWLREKDTLWIPYQVGLEFHRNRVVTVVKHLSMLGSLKIDINKIRKSVKTHQKFFADHTKLIEILDHAARLVEATIKDQTATGLKYPPTGFDTLLHELDPIFDTEAPVGENLAEEKLEEIYNQAKSRYRTLARWRE